MAIPRTEAIRDEIQALLFFHRHPPTTRDEHDESLAAWKRFDELTQQPIAMPGRDASGWLHDLRKTAWAVHTAPGKRRPYAAMDRLKGFEDELRVLVVSDEPASDQRKVERPAGDAPGESSEATGGMDDVARRHKGHPRMVNQTASRPDEWRLLPGGRTAVASSFKRRFDNRIARIGQLTAGDFHPIRLAALSAAPIPALSLTPFLRLEGETARGSAGKV